MGDRKPEASKNAAPSKGAAKRATGSATTVDDAKKSVQRNAARRQDEIRNAQRPDTIEDRAHTVKNTLGDDVSCVLNSVTHLDDLIQGADYVGHEPVYCEFTQQPCFRLIDQSHEIAPIDDGRLTTVWSEIIKFCSLAVDMPKGGFKYIPAKFNYKDMERIIGTLRYETKHRLSHRRINRAADLFDAFCPVGDAADGEFVADWFLNEWGATAAPGRERELVRQLSIRMGVNILDRAYRPGGGLKMWPVLVGPSNLGKTLFTRNILPQSMLNAKLHGQALALSKSRDEIVRKIAGELVCELPELADVQVKETERLKDILSMSVEKARVLYLSWEREFNMTCAFVGTANPERPLLPPSDPALTLRLPLIVIEGSPWGRTKRVEMQMSENGEELKQRLWRGWKYWYREAGVDPELPLDPDLQDLVLQRAQPYTYIDTGTSEALKAVEHIMRSQWAKPMGPDEGTAEGDVAKELFNNGVMAVDLVRVLDRTGFRMSGVRNPTVKIGRLLATDTDWVRVGGNTKGYRWTYRPLCEERNGDVPSHGAVRRMATTIGIDLTGPPAPRDGDHAIDDDDDDTIPF